MPDNNWYENYPYLQRIYEFVKHDLSPFPKNWSELQEWFRHVNNNIPSSCLFALIGRIDSNDIMSKNQAKEYLSKTNILGKRDFENIWKTILIGRKTTVISNNQEPTTKEITDIVSHEILDKYEIITLKESDQIMVKNSIHFSFDISNIESDIIKSVEPYTKGTYRSYLDNILLKIEKITKISQYDFYTDPWVISFQNGLYDVTTDKFHTHDSPICQDIKLFYALPHDYREGHYDCPKFKKALFNWFAYPECGFADVLLSDIFETIGYCLTMNNGLKTSFMNYGPPDTGKTQMLNIIMGIVGKLNYSMIGLGRMIKNEFGTIGMQFKILNAAGETPKRKLYDTDIFKNITGGDAEIPAEIKKGKQFKYPPYAKQYFNANFIPPIDNPNDNAFFNRFILFAFRNIFTQKECTRDFYEDIVNDEDEIQGIIHNAIKGLHRLRRRNGFRLKLRKNTRHIWLYESDPVYKFLYDNCSLDKKERIKSEKLWEFFNEVSSITLSKQKLTLELQKHRIIKKPVRTPTPEKPNKMTEFYIGATLKDEKEGDIDRTTGKIDLDKILVGKNMIIDKDYDYSDLGRF